MKTLCVLIPRFELSHADAIAATTWNITAGSLHENVLDELHECIEDLFAFEIFLLNQTIYLCFTAAGATTDILAGSIYAIWPQAELELVPDLTFDVDEESEIATTEVRLVKDSIYPFQDWGAMKADSMAPIVSALSGIGPDDRVIIQMVAQPATDTAGLHFDLFYRRLSDRVRHLFRPKYWFKRGVGENISKAITKKILQKLYRMNIRIAAIRPGGKADPEAAAVVKANLKTAFHALTFVNTLDLNGLKMGPVRTGVKSMQKFQQRYMGKPYYLSSIEFSTLWHVPSPSILPNTARVLALKGAPPGTIPTDKSDSEVCWFGTTDYREQRVPFGIGRADRSGHMYVVGNSGTGKSCLMQLLTRNDLESGNGFAVLDPHGDLIEDILKLIPEHRIDDVVYFDPTDKEFPLSFNPLEQVPDRLKIRVAIGFIEMFRKLFEDAWSERLEHLLRYTILALLSTRGTTLLSIRRMLTNSEYRKSIASNVPDYTVRKFWLSDFETWSEQYSDEAITPLLDRVGQFLSSNMIRNVVCQPMNRLRLREIMDERKILLMKIPAGILGEESASLLGGMMIAKIYQAAMSRADIPAAQRVPFYLYVDEFQNFATSAFAEILSESRKYGLSLTVGHQYLDQIPVGIRQAIFGNVANVLSFRVGGGDAGQLAREFQPRFGAEDISNLAVRDFYFKMSIRGRAQEAFSGRTLDVLYPKKDFAQACIDTSRQKYAVSREHATSMLSSWEERPTG